MAGYGDPFTPGEDSDPNAGLDMSTFAKLHDQWSHFLGGNVGPMADPRVQGAMLSAGIQMLQPRSFGQTPLGQVGMSLGNAGESVRTNEKLDLAQKDSDSKAMLREAQADKAAAGAQIAGARSDVAALNAELRGKDYERKREQGTMAAKIRLSQQYQQYVKDVRKRNQDTALLNPNAPQEPVLDFEPWIRANPMLKNLGLLPEATGGAGEGGDEGDTGGGGPAVGTVSKGYRFKGGDPKDRNNWEKVK